MPAKIPAINLELIFKTVVKVENKNILHTTRRKLLQIRSRCADCAAAQSEYLPSLLCAIAELGSTRRATKDRRGCMVHWASVRHKGFVREFR